MVKKLTQKEIDNIIYRVDQAIANSAIEGIETPPEERDELIELGIKEESGELTKEQVIEILIESVFGKKESVA